MAVGVIFQLSSRRLLVEDGHKGRHRSPKGTRAGLRLHARSGQDAASCAVDTVALTSPSGVAGSVRRSVWCRYHQLYSG
jgi:hypothetical protein